MLMYCWFFQGKIGEIYLVSLIVSKHGHHQFIPSFTHRLRCRIYSPPQPGVVLGLT